MGAGHAKYSPSAASRWSACPGSVALIDQVQPENKTTVYSAEGTAAHFIASEILMGQWQGTESVYVYRSYATDGEWAGYPREDVEGVCERIFAFNSADLMDDVLVYVNIVNSLVKPADTLVVEHRVDLSSILGLADQGGTADAIVIDAKNRTLDVADLKFGRGVEVSAVGNLQLALYGLGALEEMSLATDFDTVRMWIIQPRLDHVDCWEVAVDELRAIGTQLAEAVKTAESENAPRIPGAKQCQWCPVKAHCQELSGYVISTTSTEIETVSDEDAETYYARLPMLESWADAIKQRVFSLAEAGKAERFKLVAGRAGNRTWTDAVQVEEACKAMRLKKDEMYDLKLKSPTQLLKVVEDRPRLKPKLEAFVSRADGKPTLAPMDDKRPAIVPVLDGFEDLT